MMIKTYCAKKILFSLFLITMMAELGAESFRVSKVHELSVAQASESEGTAKVGINEALAITLPEDKTFIEGLELKFDIPESTDKQYEELKTSVNPVRLKNHPVALDEGTIDRLYHEILR